MCDKPYTQVLQERYPQSASMPRTHFDYLSQLRENLKQSIAYSARLVKQIEMIEKNPIIRQYIELENS